MNVKSAIALLTVKTKIIIGCCMAVAAAAAVVVGIVLGRDETYRVLKVFEMNGSSVITREELGELDAYVGMNLENGDTVNVGEESTLRLVLDNDKYVLLDSGTVMKLNAAGNASDSRTSIELQKGTILNEITNPLSANSSYEVATPKATMAVRGTSFIVSVTENPDGSYNINVYTLDGKVEVTLLDSEGNPTDKKAMVSEGYSVAIITEPNSESGNPAEIDGSSRFVYIDENGIISELGNGDDPVREIIYDLIPQNLRMVAVNSHDGKLMVLAENIIRKLRGENTDEHTEDKPSAGSEDVTGDAETEPAVTTVPTDEEEPAVTTVPTTAETEEKTTQTASPVHIEYTDNSTNTKPTGKTQDNTDTSKTSEKTTTTVTTVPETDTDSTTGKTTTGKTTTVTTPKTTTTSTSGTIPTTPTAPAVTTVPEAEKYEVRFMCNGDLMYIESVKKGDKVSSVPALPGLDGYTGEWKIGTQVFDPNTAITKNITVNAVYTAKKYTITYVPSYDTTKVLKTEQVEYGKKPSGFTPDTVVDTNGDDTYDYYLWGWDSVLNSFGTVKENAAITVPYEHYSDIFEVRVTDKDTVLIHKLCKNGDTLTLPTPTSTVEEGYEFKGWGMVGSGGIFNTGLKEGSGAAFEPSNPENMILNGVKASGTEVTLSGGNTAYIAVYKPIQLTVTFSANDADTPYSKNVTSEYGKKISELTLPTVPAKTGYTGKWTYNDADLDGTMTITSNITITAAYTKNKYTVKYIPSYDTTAVLETEQVEYGEKPSGFTPDTVVYNNGDGYYLWSWDTVLNSFGTVKEDASITVPYAAYDEIHEVKITDNGTVLIHKLYKNGDTLTLPTPTSTVEEGYEFKGWGEVYSGGYNTGLKEGSGRVYDELDTSVTLTPLSSGASVTLNSNKNIAYMAVYKPIQLTVTYIADGTTVHTEKVNYGTAISDLTLPAVPTKAEYTGQWTIGGVAIESYGGNLIKENLTIIAEYTKIP